MKWILCSDVDAEQLVHLRRCLRERGDDAEICHALLFSRYRQLHGKGHLSRIWLRIITKILYPLKLGWKALWAPKGTVFVITTSPFFAPLLVSLVGHLRKHRVIELLFDLYPDAIWVLQPGLKGNLLCRLVGAVTKQTQRYCDAVVYLGPFIQAHVEKQYGPARHGAVIDVITDSLAFPQKLPNDKPETVVFRYGGQLGHMHDVDSLCAGIRAVANTPEVANTVRIEFFASGAGVSRAKELLKGCPVPVNPPDYRENWRTAMSSYQLGLVTLSPGGATVCFPSKTYAMMAGGLAILAICPAWSDLAAKIREWDMGWVVNNSPYDTLSIDDPDYTSKALEVRDPDQVARDFVETVQSIVSDPETLLRKRQNAWRAAHEHYTDDWFVSHWQALVPAPRD